jgi:two-component system chemotaxis response regulator CheB
MIKVLLADDSALVRAVLKDIFQETKDITVIGEAGDGREAVALTIALKPDLIVLDLMMPIMDGLEAIEEIMAEKPTPILVLSATLEQNEVNRAFTAIKKGALDVMGKPAMTANGSIADFTASIIDKVRLLAGIRVIHHPRWKSRPEQSVPTKVYRGNRSILAIGASTGGPKAVMSIIKSLPKNFTGAGFIVQHISSGFAAGFAQWLNHECAIEVRIAEDGDDITEGIVLVAPNNRHMVYSGGKLRMIDSAPVNCCRPSIDVFFNSLPEDLCKSMVSVLLTGMGRDGAQGMLHIRERGGYTIVQDEQSSAVFGMPKAAIALNAAEEVLPLVNIPAAITKLFAR